MNSFLQVKNLYDEPTSNSFLFLKQIDPLKGILEQRCLVFFLRYVENIPHMEALQVAKTLLLWCRLYRVDHAKMARLTAENEAPMWQDVNSKIDKGSTHGIIYGKMVDFHRAVTRAESSVPTEEQIEVLTRDLHKLRELGESEEGSWGRMSDFLYWLAEEELYRLWVHIQDQLPYFMSYDSSKFEVFYRQYCLFCTHRRKVPVIRHKMLKSVRINIYINQQIQEKSKEFKERSKGYVFRLKRNEGIVDFCEDSDQE